MAEQRHDLSLLLAARRVDEALAELHRAQQGGATVVRITELRAILTGRRVTKKVA